MAITRTNPLSMRLSWNEIRARAAAFAADWKDAHYEKGETQTFYNEFFEIFGVTRRRVASFEAQVRMLENKHGFIDLFWKGVLLVEQKSAGRDLKKAKAQAFEYFPGLKESELPRYLLISDFQTFELYDLDEGTEARFGLADLPKHVEAFGFVIGVQKRTFKDQDPVNIEASELLGRLHDALEESGYTGHDLERFLVRLLFCLFADDTGIFEPRDIFLELLTERTRPDGSDLGSWLSSLFEVLNTRPDQRQRTLDEDLARFSYVNGDLFAERLRIPAFNSEMRGILIEACEFSWDAISPAIFGSLFQSVMEPAERRAQGAHYTTEKNILKVIEPLFLDRLRDEFAHIKALKRGREKALQDFQKGLSELRFFDPACGCGNFLIIAYRELRQLELELIRELNPRGQRVIDVSALSLLNVNQFYGIEIDEFPARIAEVALWMMDHIMNVRLSLEFGEVFARIPLKVSPHIHSADALELDWKNVIAPEACSYVLGNPPFVGSKLQSEKQRAQVRAIAALGKSGGTLDYVCAWFIKAGDYVQAGKAQIGFVATNSITQGEQVGQLWPILFDRFKLEITFAHRTFAWGSDARGKAHVHVVIIGLSKVENARSVKQILSYNNISEEPHQSEHEKISPYLIDATKLANPKIIVIETTKQLNNLPKLVFGNMPNDGGHLILSEEEYHLLLSSEPETASILRRLIGARDFIENSKRYCIWLQEANPSIIRNSALIKERIEKVRAYRGASNRAATKKLANSPGTFGEIRHTGEPYILIPRHSSERREYVPMGFFDGNDIAHDSCLFAPGSSLALFGLLSSAMHISWLRNIGGRIKSDYRYSIGQVYNTFPTPTARMDDLAILKPLAADILKMREAHPSASLADLYDPDAMPIDLRRAHHVLDRKVESLYRREPFTSDRERVEYLLSLYEKMVTPLTAQPKKSRSRKT